jgi:multidrug efflux system outer membrane protein
MTFKPRLKLAFTVFAAAMLSACAGMTPGTTAYSRPDLTLPATLAAQAPTATASTDSSAAKAHSLRLWWKGFGDPVLDALLDEAAQRNQDLALATARLEEARASVAQSHANLYPTVDLNAAVARRRASENAASFSPGAQPVSEDRQLGLTASYEFDFWGRYARADEAARARLLAQSASQGSVLTTLYANVALSYFALRALDTQASLAETTLATRQENLHLQKRRFEGGVVGELDLRQAESESASVLATLQQVRQSRAAAETALAVLLGRQPADIVRPVLARGTDLSALFAAQQVPADLPSDLLGARPDIVAAEQNLIAAHADIGQARAAYFPRLSLTASAGQQSRDMSTLLDPASLFWSMVGNLTQPIFRAGAIDALVSAANARQQQALAQYTQTVQNAFKDVHDAMNNVDAGRQIADTTALRITALRETLRLADLRYKAGYTSSLEVLSAQRDLAQAESGLIDVQRSQLSAVVSLYKALGGGWDAASLSALAAPAAH